jgi:Tol biopolymer transport system component
MEKRIIIALLLIATLAVGCSDNFLSSSDDPITGNPGRTRIIYNRYELQYAGPILGFMPSLLGIESSTLDSRVTTTIVPGPVLLAGPPQAGKILYFQVNILNGYLDLIVSDIDGRNIIEVTSLQDLFSPQLQQAALSPDGRTVAYIRSTTQIKGGRRLYVASLILFDMSSQTATELDNFASFVSDGQQGGGFPKVNQFVSQLEFSPDGNTLAVAQWGENALISIYEIGSHQRIARTSPGSGPFCTWASDSKTLFYTKSNGGRIKPDFTFEDQVNELTYTLSIPVSSDIRTLNIQTGAGNVVEVASAAVMELDVSALDSALVYSQYSGYKTDPFECDLIVKNLHDGTNSRMLTSSTQPVSRMHPQWSVDGSSILFTEYIILEAPQIFPSSINQISTKTGKNSIVVNNAYGGYWMP